VKVCAKNEAAKESSTNIPNETDFLRKLLAIYMNQTFYVSGKLVVLSPPELVDLIVTLLPGKRIELDLEDVDVSCCSKSIPLQKVNSIWVVDVNGEEEIRSNFKYVFSHLAAVLDEYHVSIKFVKVAA